MYKKILRALAASALFSVLLVVPAFAESAEVTGNDVNLRAGPGSGYRVVDCLPKGASVNVTDRSNSSWYEVEYNGETGFMYSAYLSISESEIESLEILSESGESGYINAMYVRFRSGPGSEYSILGEYNRGKTVTITGSSGSWTACEIDGQAGYVYSDYITRGSAESVVATEQPSATTDPYLDTGSSGSSGSNTLAPLEETEIATEPTATPTAAPTAAPVETEVPSVSSESAQGYINGDYVRFRTGPSTSYSIINSYNKGKTVEITGTSGDWTACVIDGESGYVYSAYVVKTETSGSTETPVETAAPVATETPTESKAGYISGNNVRMRAGASMSSDILDELFYGNAVTITGTSGDWTAVIYNGTSGYVYSTYVKEGTYSYTEVTESESGSATGKDIANYALQFVGYNYCWGGKSPSTGFDCSGLVYYVYSQFGYTLNRVAADQAKNGVHVDSDDLQPGDILCFYSGGSYIGHVGIYIGDGKFVHAANSSTGVIVTELSGYYSSRGYEARRIVG